MHAAMAASVSNIPPRLLDLHPLFRRLSGEIVWLMFEEHDADPDDIQAYMDDLHGLLGRTKELIEAALSGEPLMARIVAEGAAPRCAACAALVGRSIDLSRDDALKLLPPYALGCPLRAEITPAAGHAEVDCIGPGDAPHGELVCGDWLFTTPWASLGEEE